MSQKKGTKPGHTDPSEATAVGPPPVKRPGPRGSPAPGPDADKPGAAASSDGPRSSHRIMAVGAGPLFGSWLRTCLEPFGLHLEAFRRAEPALHSARAQPPALLLLVALHDAHIGSNEGLVLDSLRSDPQLCAIPVVAMLPATASGHAREDNALASLTDSIDDHLVVDSSLEALGLAEKIGQFLELPSHLEAPGNKDSGSPDNPEGHCPSPPNSDAGDEGDEGVLESVWAEVLLEDGTQYRADIAVELVDHHEDGTGLPPGEPRPGDGPLAAGQTPAAPKNDSDLGQRVLVLGDAPVFMRWVGDELRRHGIEVTVVADSTQALTRARSDSPDAILLVALCGDVPHLSGYAIGMQLKEDPRVTETPLLCIATDAPADGPPWLPLKERSAAWLSPTTELPLLLAELDRWLSPDAVSTFPATRDLRARRRTKALSGEIDPMRITKELLVIHADTDSVWKQSRPPPGATTA